MPSGATLLCSNAPSIPPWYFRALYREVGRAHEWTDWLRRSDAELESFVTAPGTILTTLLLDGAPRGFYMLRCEQASAELLYFGLTPDALGRQLGGPLLRHAVQAAWEEPRLQALHVNTNTLDHPNALPLYKSVGFKVERVERCWRDPQSESEKQAASDTRGMPHISDPD